GDELLTTSHALLYCGEFESVESPGMTEGCSIVYAAEGVAAMMRSRSVASVPVPLHAPYPAENQMMPCAVSTLLRYTDAKMLPLAICTPAVAPSSSITSNTPGS